MTDLIQSKVTGGSSHLIRTVCSGTKYEYLSGAVPTPYGFVFVEANNRPGWIDLRFIWNGICLQQMKQFDKFPSLQALSRQATSFARSIAESGGGDR